MKIPFNKPSIVGNELQYIQDAVSVGSIAAGGKYTELCESFLENRYLVPKVMLTTSCTDALELAALILDIQPGDKILIPSYTYVSTANAFALRGAVITFVDCNKDTLTIDLEDLNQKIDRSFKACVVMHYAGVPIEMDKLLEICNSNEVVLVEDAALAIESSYKGKQLGTFGQLGTFSFHQTKNVISGEGGALLINNDALIEKAYVHRDKGTDRYQFHKGEVDKYTWQNLGSSFAPTDMVSAYLWGQLECIDQIQEQRKQLWKCYQVSFKELEVKGKVTLGKEGNGSVFYFLVENSIIRNQLIEALHQAGIKAVFHYQPLDGSPFINKDRKKNIASIAQNCSERIVRLPLFYSLSHTEQEYVIKCVLNFYN